MIWGIYETITALKTLGYKPTSVSIAQSHWKPMLSYMDQYAMVVERDQFGNTEFTMFGIPFERHADFDSGWYRVEAIKDGVQAYMADGACIITPHPS